MVVSLIAIVATVTIKFLIRANVVLVHYSACKKITFLNSIMHSLSSQYYLIKFTTFKFSKFRRNFISPENISDRIINISPLCFIWRYKPHRIYRDI